MFCQICGIDVPSTTTKCPKCGGNIFVDENSPVKEAKTKQKDIEILTPLVSQTSGRWGLLCLLYSLFAVAFEGGFTWSCFSLFIGAFLVDRQRRVNKENNIKIRRVKYMIVCYAMFALIVVRNNVLAYQRLNDDQQSADALLQQDNLGDFNECLMEKLNSTGGGSTPTLKDSKISNHDELTYDGLGDDSENQVAVTSLVNSVIQQESALVRQSNEMSSEDEVAIRLSSFLGYTFGKKYEGRIGNCLVIRLRKPFRYIKEGMGICDGQGRLIQLSLSGDFPDGMSLEGAQEELHIMKSMFERKYGICMKEHLENIWRYRSKNGEVRIEVLVSGREFSLFVENKRVLSLGKKVEVLGADVGADML